MASRAGVLLAGGAHFQSSKGRTMIAWAYRFVFAVSLTAMAHGVMAQTQMSVHAPPLVSQGTWESPVRPVAEERCQGDHFKALTKVGSLPAEVRSLIAQDGGVADRDAAWDYSDVKLPGDRLLPHFRLLMAAIGQRRMFVMIQQGGGPYINRIWRFDRPRIGWVLAKTIPGGVEPASLGELLYQVCVDHPKPPSRR